MDRILLDTGFLVALARPRDPLHEAARTFLAGCSLRMATVTAVIVETCHFLRLDSRRAFLEGIAHDGPAIVEVPPEAYPELSRTMQRYKERDVDFADAALLWLAEQSGHRAILTVDETDFRRFRLKGGGRFEVIEWR